MRAPMIPTELRSTSSRRVWTVCAALLVAISTLSAATPTQADPPIELTIDFLGADDMGTGEWHITGAVIAEDPTAVTITFGGAGSGTKTPDESGFFCTIVTGDVDDTVTVDATDSSGSDSDQIKLGRGA